MKRVLQMMLVKLIDWDVDLVFYLVQNRVRVVVSQNLYRQKLERVRQALHTPAQH
jgi:hypothetical protein